MKHKKMNAERCAKMTTTPFNTFKWFAILAKSATITKCATFALCAILSLLAFSGCQLAQEDKGANAHEDRMIGVFITTEYLDLFDFEGYLERNLGSFRGGEIQMGRDADQYQGRIVATLTTITLTNEETGEEIETEEFIFDGIDGISFFAPTIHATEERDSYIASMSDEAISGGFVYIHMGDDESRRTMEGTIYVSPSESLTAYYINPVFQSSDGSVYMTSGSGISFSGDGVGVTMSQTMSAVYTVTEHGRTTTESFSITISVSTMHAPEIIIIMQMDADNAPVLRTEYEPDAMPEVITLEADTAFVIVESHSNSGIDNISIHREIYGRDSDGIETFYDRDDGILVKRWTAIAWE